MLEEIVSPDGHAHRGQRCDDIHCGRDGLDDRQARSNEDATV